MLTVLDHHQVAGSNIAARGLAMQKTRQVIGRRYTGLLSDFGTGYGGMVKLHLPFLTVDLDDDGYRFVPGFCCFFEINGLAWFCAHMEGSLEGNSALGYVCPQF